MDPITIALTLAKFAPSILKYLGVGDTATSVAEKAIEVAQAITGTDSPIKAIEVLQADPAKVLEYQIEIAKVDSELEKAYLSDRNSARTRDVAFITTGQKNIRGDVLAYIAILSLIALIAMLFFRGDEMPASVKDLLLVLSGSLVAIVKDVYSFEFGTTRASKTKDQVISNLAEKN